MTVIVMCVLVSILGATLDHRRRGDRRGLEDPIAGGAAASHPRLILALLANLLLAPIFLTLQAVIVTGRAGGGVPAVGEGRGLTNLSSRPSAQRAEPGPPQALSRGPGSSLRYARDGRSG
jgi:hypothetical protein